MEEIDGNRQGEAYHRTPQAMGEKDVVCWSCFPPNQLLVSACEYQVYDKEPAIIVHAKDLAFEEHYLLEHCNVRRTLQPSVATNTPKEILASSGDKEM